MLQYALAIANSRFATDVKADAAALILMNANEDGYSEETIDRLVMLIVTLFNDAKVEFQRTSRRGEDYSIAEEAANEFLAWYNMPWE